MNHLKPHGSETAHYDIKFNIQTTEKQLVVEYQIHGPASYKFQSFGQSLPRGRYWGLWERDVFEIFLKDNSNDSLYYEFQVSPSENTFHLGIIRPRELYFTPLNIEWKHTYRVQDSLWSGQVILPGDKFVPEGNIHACLGLPGQREFYGLCNNPENEPDFHRPELFGKLCQEN